LKAYALPPRANPPANPPPSPAPATVTLTRVNGVFTVAADYELHKIGLSWQGSSPLEIDGAWHEFPIRKP
jgi:hypothetical protein